MSRQLHMNQAAEREANEIAFRFMNSSDVVGDMSRAYRTDLSSVRIHTDESAARKAEDTGADAFSTGRDVFFGRGVFDQGNPASRGLLAHELAHSLQQGIGGGEPGMVTQSVPEGAVQGGRFTDFLRRIFGKKKEPEPEPELAIGNPQNAERNTDPEAASYMKTMTKAVTGGDPRQRAGFIQNMAIPEAHVGRNGGAEAAENLRNQLLSPDASDPTQRTFLQQSNEAFRTRGRSDALTNLGIRGSQNATARAEIALRGDTYAGLGEDYRDFIYNLQEGGLDMGAMLNNEEMRSAILDDGTQLAYATGAGFDAVSSKAMDMFTNYILSDESLDYIEKFSQSVGDAEVFGGQIGGLTGASGFALQTLVNTVGGNINSAIRDKRLSGESQRVAVNMGRNMGSLPKMAALNEEEIPEGLRPLRTRYIQLQEELDRRLQERRGG